MKFFVSVFTNVINFESHSCCNFMLACLLKFPCSMNKLQIWRGLHPSNC